MSTNITQQGLINASGETINPNLLTNTDFANTYQQTTGWNTTKNGTTLATSWGGYNSGVTNASTVYHAHMKQFQGEWVYEYIRTADESWLAIWQGGLQTYIKPNTTYTWSIDEYRTSGSNNYITAGIYYKKTSDGSNGFHSGLTHGTGEDAFDKWVRRYYTFTTTEVYTGSGITFYIYGQSGGNGTIYVRKPKLEIGSVATPWSKAASENNDITFHGFVESQRGMSSIYNNYIEATEFIEW